MLWLFLYLSSLTLVICRRLLISYEFDEEEVRKKQKLKKGSALKEINYRKKMTLDA